MSLSFEPILVSFDPGYTFDIYTNSKHQNIKLLQ